MSIMGIALSGMRASEVRMNAAANNIVNAGTTDYVPQQATDKSLSGGGVTTNVAPIDPSSVVVDGGAFPSVDMAAQVATMMMAELSYKASASLVKTADEMSKSLLRA